MSRDDCFRSQLAICEIFILKIVLAKLWLASVGEQDTYEQLRMRLRLTLVHDDAYGKFRPYQLQLLNWVALNLIQANLLHFPIRSVCMAPISLAWSGPTI